jgi:hypothetical protein
MTIEEAFQIMKDFKESGDSNNTPSNFDEAVYTLEYLDNIMLAIKSMRAKSKYDEHRK